VQMNKMLGRLTGVLRFWANEIAGTIAELTPAAKDFVKVLRVMIIWVSFRQPFSKCDFKRQLTNSWRLGACDLPK